MTQPPLTPEELADAINASPDLLPPTHPDGPRRARQLDWLRDRFTRPQPVEDYGVEWSAPLETFEPAPIPPWAQSLRWSCPKPGAR